MKDCENITLLDVWNLLNAMNSKFEQIDKRFEQIDKRFEQIDKRFEQIDKRFEQIDKRFEQIDKRFEQIDKRFEQIDKRFEQIDKRFEQIDKRFEQIDKRFDAIESKIDRIDFENKEAHNKIFEELKYINNTLLKIETEHEDKIKALFDADKARKEHQTLFENQLRRLSKDIENNSFRISNLEKSLSNSY